MLKSQMIVAAFAGHDAAKKSAANGFGVKHPDVVRKGYETDKKADGSRVMARGEPVVIARAEEIPRSIHPSRNTGNTR